MAEAHPALAIVRAMLARLGTAAVVVGHHQTRAWPRGLREHLVEAGWLMRVDNATGLLCDGCPRTCWIRPGRLPQPNGRVTLTHLCRQGDGLDLLTFEEEELFQWRLHAEGITHWLKERLGDRAHVHHQGLTWLIEVQAGPRRDGEGRLIQHHLEDVLIWSDAGPTLDATTIWRGCGVPAQLRQERVLSLPPDATWERVIIRIQDEVRAEVQYGDRRRLCTFAELGMADLRRDPPEPASSWALLRIIAQAGGSLTWGDQGANPRARAQMKMLRHALRGAFGLEGDPFLPYTPKEGWRARFGLISQNTGVGR